MEKINRYYLVFGFWAAILFYAAFMSNNVYFNAFLLFFGFIGSILACGYIMENQNAKESKFVSKIMKKIGFE